MTPKNLIKLTAFSGAAIGAAVAGWTMIEYAAGLHDMKAGTGTSLLRMASSAVALPIVLGGVYVGMSVRRGREPGGEISIVSLLISGILIAAFAGAAVGLWTAIYDGLVNPGYLERMADEAKRQLEQEGVPAREINNRLASRFGLASHVIMGCLSTAVVGGVGAVLAAILMRKREAAGERRLRD